ncbi:MAG: hypothetical protein F6K65_11525 [Moorea sp. SIO3C2]|nr:hypothetical protein [Moorena sp. SIO3C2]
MPVPHKMPIHGNWQDASSTQHAHSWQLARCQFYTTCPFMATGKMPVLHNMPIPLLPIAYCLLPIAYCLLPIALRIAL